MGQKTSKGGYVGQPRRDSYPRAKSASRSDSTLVDSLVEHLNASTSRSSKIFGVAIPSGGINWGSNTQRISITSDDSSAGEAASDDDSDDEGLPMVGDVDTFNNLINRPATDLKHRWIISNVPDPINDSFRETKFSRESGFHRTNQISTFEEVHPTTRESLGNISGVPDSIIKALALGSSGESTQNSSAGEESSPFLEDDEDYRYLSDMHRERVELLGENFEIDSSGSTSTSSVISDKNEDSPVSFKDIEKRLTEDALTRLKREYMASKTGENEEDESYDTDDEGEDDELEPVIVENDGNSTESTDSRDQIRNVKVYGKTNFMFENDSEATGTTIRSKGITGNEYIEYAIGDETPDDTNVDQEFKNVEIGTLAIKNKKFRVQQSSFSVPAEEVDIEEFFGDDKSPEAQAVSERIKGEANKIDTEHNPTESEVLSSEKSDDKALSSEKPDEKEGMKNSVENTNKYKDITDQTDNDKPTSENNAKNTIPDAKHNQPNSEKLAMVKHKSILLEKSKSIAIPASGCYLVLDADEKLTLQWSKVRVHNALAFFSVGAGVQLPQFKLEHGTTELTFNIMGARRTIFTAIISFLRTAQKFSGVVIFYPGCTELGFSVYACERNFTLTQLSFGTPVDLAQDDVLALSVMDDTVKAYQGFNHINKVNFINIGNKNGAVLDLDNDVLLRQQSLSRGTKPRKSFQRRSFERR